jgi:hypothetical protein
LAFDEEDESSDDDPVLGPSPAKGVPIYTFDQTQLYIPPPVVAGRIPKNRFGNLDTYVPSMVPAGGAHIVYQRAGHAAHILGIDYAPALTGFDWKGRKGTAVYSGVVVPAEAEEAVRAVIEGFEDLEQLLEEERRSLRALATWKRLLRGLRIRKSVFAGEDMFDESIPLEDIPVDEDEEMVDAGLGQEAGGFEPDYDQAGGFEPGGFGPGGFEPGGFESGDFEPGGFEPGGFEPGGFEPTIGDKGKEPETRGSDDYDAYEPEVASSARQLRLRRTRLLESDEEDEEQPGDIGPHHGGSTGSNIEPYGSEADRAEEDQPQPIEGIAVEADEPVNNELQAGSQPGGLDGVAEPVITEEQLDQPGMASEEAIGESPGHRLSTDCQIHGDETQNNAARAGSEDAELEDADSDTTEELYMDEDGALVD